MHHDGMHFFPLPMGSNGSLRGLLALNHEYYEPELLHADGVRTMTAEKVQKEQHAVGVSVAEVALENGSWTVQRPSQYARRIHARRFRRRWISRSRRTSSASCSKL